MSKRFWQRLFSLWWIILPLILSPFHYAHAYVDPGTGSYAIQVIVGVLFGGGYALKSFGGRIVSRFRRQPSSAATRVTTKTAIKAPAKKTVKNVKKTTGGKKVRAKSG